MILAANLPRCQICRRCQICSRCQWHQWQFATVNNDTGCKFAPGRQRWHQWCTSPWAANISANLKKIWNCPNGILRGLGETDSWKNLKSRCTVPLNFILHIPIVHSESHRSRSTVSVNLLKGPPPHTHTERKANLRQWRQYILRAEGGISGAMLRKCSPVTQFRRQQEKPGPLLLVYFMSWANKSTIDVDSLLPSFTWAQATKGRDCATLAYLYPSVVQYNPCSRRDKQALPWALHKVTVKLKFLFLFCFGEAGWKFSILEVSR
jgi:hypothetical protein